jgi:hypothetical protein
MSNRSAGDRQGLGCRTDRQGIGRGSGADIGRGSGADMDMGRGLDVEQIGRGSPGGHLEQIGRGRGSPGGHLEQIGRGRGSPGGGHRQGRACSRCRNRKGAAPLGPPFRLSEDMSQSVEN